MKLTVKREDLLRPIQLVVGVVERRQTMPILANILLSVKDNQLSTLATDLEVELSSTIELNGAVKQSGTITVSGRKIADICRSLPAGCNIELEENNKILTLHTTNSHFNLSTLPADDFPHTQNQIEQASFSLPEKTLRSVVQRTHFAIAENNPHYYLNGLALEIKDNTVHAIASDAHRLSSYTIDQCSTTNDGATLRIIVPKKAIVELMRLLSNTEDLVKIGITKNYIRFQTTSFTLTSKLIDSKYPNYSKLIPRGGDKKIILDRETFKNALVRVGILSNEILRSMQLELLPNTLRMISHNTEQEQAQETLPIEYGGEHLEVGFNIAYLLDVLATMSTEQLAITLKDNLTGAILEEVNGEENCLYVIMPFQI